MCGRKPWKNGLLCNDLLARHIRLIRLQIPLAKIPNMFPHHPIRFLMSHLLFPQFLWVFPMFPLVFLPVSYFRSSIFSWICYIWIEHVFIATRGAKKKLLLYKYTCENVFWRPQQRLLKIRSSTPKVFYNKEVLKKYRRKHLFRSFVFNRVTGTEAVTPRCSVKKVFLDISQNSQDLKKRQRCFPVNSAKFLRTSFL